GAGPYDDHAQAGGGFGTPALARRLGAWRRAPRQRPAPAGGAPAASAGAPASDRRPGRLLEGEAALRRPPSDRDLGWGASRQGDRGALLRTRHADPRGLGSHRMHDRSYRQPTA